MVDRVTKSLRKFSSKESKAVKQIIEGKTQHLHIRKLKNHDSVYRARKGQIRIMYRINNDKKVIILAVERRSSTTYNRL